MNEYFIYLTLVILFCFYQSSSDDDRIDGKEIDNPKIELLFHETTKNFDKLPIQYRVSKDNTNLQGQSYHDNRRNDHKIKNNKYQNDLRRQITN